MDDDDQGNDYRYGSMDMVHRTKQGKQIWLGDMWAASNINGLRQKSISSVLTSAERLGIKYAEEHNISHKIINARDQCLYKMTPHFQQTFNFIDDSLRRGNILVHCAAGVSRSATFVVAYLMKAEKMPFPLALGYVQKSRPCVYPNDGFQNELRKYEFNLKKDNKMKIQLQEQKTFERREVHQFLNTNKKNLKINKNKSAIVATARDYKINAATLIKGLKSYRLNNPVILTINK